jgi:hypothetical protein
VHALASKALNRVVNALAGRLFGNEALDAITSVWAAEKKRWHSAAFLPQGLSPPEQPIPQPFQLGSAKGVHFVGSKAATIGSIRRGAIDHDQKQGHEIAQDAARPTAKQNPGQSLTPRQRHPA